MVFKELTMVIEETRAFVPDEIYKAQGPWMTPQTIT
jgi:hypothetical protein